jgi:23S rRNA pseudouridine2605 synthase
MQKQPKTIRIDKYLANHGIASRRTIQIFLKGNAVTVDGKRITEHGERIDEKASVLINGKRMQKPKTIYIAVHKPKGIISTANDEFGRDNVVGLVNVKERLYPVGRLDQNTTGLILLTNDGELANKLTHPRYHVPKTYTLLAAGRVSENQLTQLKEGVALRDGMTAPAQVKITKQLPDKTVLEMVLFEGRKRQIRRMCEALHINLLELKRISIGTIQLGGLKEGSFRYLTDSEIESLRKSGA